MEYLFSHKQFHVFNFSLTSSQCEWRVVILNQTVYVYIRINIQPGSDMKHYKYFIRPLKVAFSSIRYQVCTDQSARCAQRISFVFSAFHYTSFTRHKLTYRQTFNSHTSYTIPSFFLLTYAAAYKNWIGSWNNLQPTWNQKDFISPRGSCWKRTCWSAVALQCWSTQHSKKGSLIMVVLRETCSLSSRGIFVLQ